MTTTILNKYSSSSSVGVGKLSGDGNELLMGEDKTDSVIPFVVSDDSYYYSTEIVSETQISADQQQLLMNNLLPCSHAYSSIDQDSIREKLNLADSPFHSKSEQESNGFWGKSRRNGRTKYGSDSLLTMILKERSRANAETAATASSLGGGPAVDLLPHEYENPNFFGSSPPPSGLLTFSSGPIIPLSGSISQRSNSTASSNSFAFPILATEWNDSPVRMAESDSRKRLKKTRWWGICFNCNRI